MLGGDKVPSFDEKNYDKGILRKCLNPNDEVKNLKYEYIYTKNNKQVVDEETLQRINDLHIPSTWGYVWISNDPLTPIQVIGHDKSGKKQYLYNKQHRKTLVEHKFSNLNLFVSNLDKLTKVVNEAKQKSKGDPFNKDYILSTIIKIILLTGMRAGKEFYAKKSNTYGITSLRCKHANIKDDKVVFTFKGKSNIMHRHEVYDKEIIDHIKQLKKLCKDDDNKLFRYKEGNEIKKIDEFVLNDYLHEKIHPKIVIKDLRTYLVNFTLIQNIIKQIKTNKATTNEKQLKKIITKAIKDTANFIQHTISVSKHNYVDPRIVKRFMSKPSYFNKHINDKPSDILVDIIKDDIIIDPV